NGDAAIKWIKLQGSVEWATRIFDKRLPERRAFRQRTLARDAGFQASGEVHGSLLRLRGLTAARQECDRSQWDTHIRTGPDRDAVHLRRQPAKNAESMFVKQNGLADRSAVRVESAQPQTVADDRRRIALNLASIFCGERATVERAHAEHVEVFR